MGNKITFNLTEEDITLFKDIVDGKQDTIEWESNGITVTFVKEDFS